jgi:hypothetical protein
MPDTGAPWSIPYAEPSDLVRDWPALSEDVADAVAAGLTNASFNAREVITATDATWPVPSLSNQIVKVTAIGGGGGGGGSGAFTSAAGDGGTTTFGVGETFVLTASGGARGNHAGGNQQSNGRAAKLGFVSGNNGQAGNSELGAHSGVSGLGGEIKVNYIDLTGKTTLNVVIGAGGAGGVGTHNGSAGGRGEVIVEYVAGV